MLINNVRNGFDSIYDNDSKTAKQESNLTLYLEACSYMISPLLFSAAITATHIFV